ncbi:MAG: hypothetical protein ABI823_04655 [Bryobacteraceae bacterium]
MAANSYMINVIRKDLTGMDLRWFTLSHEAADLFLRQVLRYATTNGTGCLLLLGWNSGSDCPDLVWPDFSRIRALMSAFKPLKSGAVSANRDYRRASIWEGDQMIARPSPGLA